MADMVYTYALAKLMSGDIDLNTDDIRMAIVMTNTTADTEEDTQLMSAFSTLDEYDGSAYARVALTAEAVSAVTASNRGKFTSDPVVFAGIGAGTRQGQAVIIYKHVGADSSNIPIFYKVPTGFPFTGNGADVQISPSSDGWAYSVNA